CKSVEQHIDALEQAKLADEHDVRRILSRDYLGEFLGGDAVVHDPHKRTRRTDFGGERVASKPAFEEKQLGAPHQHLFKREVEKPDRRRAARMQAAAMRRADANAVPAPN